MVAPSSQPARAGAGLLVQLAVLPARLVGRFKPDLANAVALDRERFAGASAVLMVLAAIAVAYPILASIAHAFGAPTQNMEALALAIRPTFDVVYTESLTFMLAGAALGMLSPAMGVLFMAVFIPADLIAADLSGELVNLAWQIPFTGLLARIASYGLLWLLVVEVPLVTRRITGSWSERGGGSAAAPVLALIGAVIGGLLVFVWTSGIGLLITPVFTWSPIQQMSNLASDPTWYYWPILVGGAALAAAIGVIWPRSIALDVVAPGDLPTGARAPSMPQVLVRQVVACLVLALLGGALITGLAEGVVVLGGLLLAGPVLTFVLPMLPMPGALANASGTVRWVAALIVAAAVTWLLTNVFWDALDLTSNLGFAIAAAIVVVVFRVALDLGRPAAWGTPAGPAAAGAPA